MKLDFTAMPSMNRSLARGLLRRRAPGAVPVVRATVGPTATDLTRLARYRDLCCLDSRGFLPVLWPQVLAGPLHAAVFTHGSMPFSALGLVHIEQHVTAECRLPVDARLSFDVHTTEARPAKRGSIFGVITEASLGDAVVWRSEMRILAPGLHTPGEPLARAPVPDAPSGRRASIYVPASIGRHYRRVTGDLNPIHLHWLLARPFGFRRAIAHGMWTLARALATLPPLPERVTLSARFMRPVELPSVVVASHAVHDARTSLAVATPDGARLHLHATVARYCSPRGQG